MNKNMFFTGCLILFVTLAFVTIVWICMFKTTGMEVQDCMSGNMPITKINHEFYGNIYVYAHNDTISEIVREKKLVWERHLVDLMVEYYKDGTDMLDVGANIGLNCLALHRLKPITGTLHCFEPQYHAMSLCVFNTSNIPNVKYYQFAVSDKYDVMSFQSVQENIGGTSMMPHLQNANVIASVPLDHIPFEKPISLIKVDVEGMEAEFLEGAKNTIHKHKPTIFIEIWENRFEKTSKVLEGMNYVMKKRVGTHDYIYEYASPHA